MADFALVRSRKATGQMNTPNRGNGRVGKDGSHKVVDECTLPLAGRRVLPLAGRRVVRGIITDLAGGDVPGSPKRFPTGVFMK